MRSAEPSQSADEATPVLLSICSFCVAAVQTLVAFGRNSLAFCISCRSSRAVQQQRQRHFLSGGRYSLSEDCTETEFAPQRMRCIAEGNPHATEMPVSGGHDGCSVVRLRCWSQCFRESCGAGGCATFPLRAVQSAISRRRPSQQCPGC